MKQDGKITILGLLMIVILFYGGFCAVKVVSVNLMESQIKKEVHDMIGLLRGPGFTDALAATKIIEILERNDIIFDKEDAEGVWVALDRKAGTIKWEFSYSVDVDLILKKYTKHYVVTDEMRSYR